MDEAVIYDGLTNIFRDVFKHPVQLRPQLTAVDVPGWDSFKQVKIIVAVEEHFDVQFNITQINGLRTVGDLVRTIMDQMERK